MDTAEKRRRENASLKTRSAEPPRLSLVFPSRRTAGPQVRMVGAPRAASAGASLGSHLKASSRDRSLDHQRQTVLQRMASKQKQVEMEELERRGREIEERRREEAEREGRELKGELMREDSDEEAARKRERRRKRRRARRRREDELLSMARDPDRRRGGDRSRSGGSDTGSDHSGGSPRSRTASSLGSDGGDYSDTDGYSGSYSGSEYSEGRYGSDDGGDNRGGDNRGGNDYADDDGDSQSSFYSRPASRPVSRPASRPASSGARFPHTRARFDMHTSSNKQQIGGGHGAKTHGAESRGYGGDSSGNLAYDEESEPRSDESSGAREARRRASAVEQRRKERAAARERRRRLEKIRKFGANADDIAFLDAIGEEAVQRTTRESSAVRPETAPAVVSHNDTMDILAAIVKRQKVADRRFEFVKKREAGLVAERATGPKGCRLPAESLAEIKAKGTDPDRMRILYKIATERHCAELSHELELLRLEAGRASHAKRSTGADVGGNDEEIKTLLDYADVLRKKHEALEAKLRTNQRKLLAFRSFDPLYRELESKFGFTSPEDLVDRLRSLEGTHESFRGKHEHALRKLSELDSQLETLRTEHELRVSRALTEAQQYLETVDTRREALERDLAEATGELDSLKPDLDAYLTLYFAVVDTWNWFEELCPALIDPSDPLEVPDKLDPILVTVALDAAASKHVPRRAHEVLHSVTVITNSLWLKYFPDREGIKGNAREVVAAVCDNLEKETLRVGQVTHRSKDAKGKLADLHAQLTDQVRAVNEAEENAQYWKEKFRWTKQYVLDEKARARKTQPRLGGGVLVSDTQGIDVNGAGGDSFDDGMFPNPGSPMGNSRPGSAMSAASSIPKQGLTARTLAAAAARPASSASQRPPRAPSVASGSSSITIS